MLNLLLIAVPAPSTFTWGPQVGIVMILCNIAAIALGKAFMRDVAAQPALPSQYSKYFGGMGWPALLATTSLGHIFGMGAIIGLSNAGIL
ncbi:MAG: photosystem I reaction center subunit PsaK [Cyanobacteria bacterium J06639_14]